MNYKYKGTEHRALTIKINDKGSRDEARISYRKYF